MSAIGPSVASAPRSAARRWVRGADSMRGPRGGRWPGAARPWQSTAS